MRPLPAATAELGAAELRISLLGSGHYTAAITGETFPISGPCGRVLAQLLLVPSRCVRREVLANDLWPEVDWSTARRRLNTVLYRLRGQIEPSVLEPTFVVTPNAAEVAFNNDADHWYDVDAFAGVAADLLDRPVLTADEAGRLEDAVSLYDGQLCGSLDADWLVAERARLSNLHMAALTTLACHHLTNRRPDSALGFAQRGLAEEPLREDLYRVVMRCHAAAGRRTLALATFQQCKSLLALELDVDPLPETTRLAVTIGRDDEEPSGPVTLSSALDTLTAARQQIAIALDDVDRAIRSLQRESR